MAKNCTDCTESGKNLKNSIKRYDMGKVAQANDPNEAVQLDFWGQINYLNESKKYFIVAVDRFSRWPSAMVGRNNTWKKNKEILENVYSNP